MEGLRLLAGADTPLRENERISFIGDSITMQGGFIRRMQEALAESDHAKNLGVQLFQHGLNGGRVDTIVTGVTPWGKQDPFSKLLEKDKPTVVVIFLGVNDVTHGDAVSPEAFEKGLTRLASEAKQAGAAVILATPAVAGENAMAPIRRMRRWTSMLRSAARWPPPIKLACATCERRSASTRRRQP